MKHGHFASFLALMAAMLFSLSFHDASAQGVEVVVTIEKYKVVDAIGIRDDPFVIVNINKLGEQVSGTAEGVKQGSTHTPKPNQFRRTVDPTTLTNSNVPITIEMLDDDGKRGPSGTVDDRRPDQPIDINPDPPRILSLNYNLISKRLDIPSPQTGTENKLGVAKYQIYYNVDSTDLVQEVDETGGCGRGVLGAHVSDTQLTDTGVNYIYRLRNSKESTFNINTWSLADYARYADVTALFPSGGIMPGNDLSFSLFSKGQPRIVELATRAIFTDGTERPVVACVPAEQIGPESLDDSIISVEQDDRNRCLGKVGTLVVEAEFTNKLSGSIFTDLFFEQVELSGGNRLCGVSANDLRAGDRIEAARTEQYQDGELSPAERASVTFFIGFDTMNKFTFLVNAFALNKMLVN